MDKMPLLLLPGQHGRTLLVNFSQICYCGAEGGYVRLYLSSGERLLATGKLKQLVQMLPSPPFYRCHHSWLVKLLCVQEMTTEGSATALYIGGDSIPVSRERRAELLLLFHRL